MTRKVDDIWKALKSGNAGPTRSTRSPSYLQKAPLTHVLNGVCNDGADVDDVNREASSKCGGNGSSEMSTFTQRDINCLSDEDRKIRKQAINKLQHQIRNQDGLSWSSELVQLFELEPLQRKLVAMLSDKSDACRDSALEVVTILMSTVRIGIGFSVRVVEALKLRMGVGQQSFLESSEEIRHGIAKLTASCIVKDAEEYGLIEEVVSILVRCVDDPFHETKKSACGGIVALAQQYSDHSLNGSYSKLVDCLIDTLRHGHSRVRSSGLQALTAVIRRPSVPSDLVKSKVVPAFQAIAMDRSSDIRIQCFRNCSIWLRERCERAHCDTTIGETLHLLPIVLLGLTDPSPSICQETVQLIESAAAAYCIASVSATSQGSAAPCEGDESYTKFAGANLPAPLSERMSKEARTMVQNELKSLLEPVLKDAQEWSAARRCTASRSLFAILALAEAAVTPYLDRILQSCCRALGDEDEGVSTRIIHCVHVAGAFCKVRPLTRVFNPPSSDLMPAEQKIVQAQHWMPLMLDYIHGLHGQPNATVCALVTIAGLERAASKAQQDIPSELVTRTATWLASPEVRSLHHPELNRQVAMVISNFIDFAGPAVVQASQPLFHSLMHLQGQQGLDQYTQGEIIQAQQKLAQSRGFSSPVQLAADHACSLLSGMLQNSPEWTSSHPDLPGFLSIFRTCPGESLAPMAEPLCKGLGQITRDHDRDAALRIEVLQAIDSVLEDDTRAPPFCKYFGVALAINVLLPPLIWRAGKSAAAVRFKALVALYTLLSKRMQGVDVKPLLNSELQVIPILVQCMDEDWYTDTRALACCTVRALIVTCGRIMTDEHRRKLYPELNTRMDDSSNDVRIATAAAMSAFAVHALPESYCDTNSGYLVAGFIIHLDDSDANVQEAVFEAMVELKKKKPRVVETEAKKMYDDFRSKHLLDKLLV